MVRRSLIHAIPLLFAFVSCVGAQTSWQCSVSGAVLDGETGQSLAGVTLTLHRIADANTNASMVSTNAAGNLKSIQSTRNGAFCFDATLDAGRYRLEGQKNGYVAYRYGAKSYLDSGMLVTVPGETAANLRVTMYVQPSISGLIASADTHLPFANANVFAARKVWSNGVLQWETYHGVSDSAGVYRIPQLMPGLYVIYTDTPKRKPEIGNEHATDVRTFFPSAFTQEEATPLVVDENAGAIQGIDIHVLRHSAYDVRGKVEAMPEDRQGGAVSLAYQADDGGLFDMATTAIAPDGTFAFTGVGDGRYLASFLSPNAAGQSDVEVDGTDVDIDLPVAQKVIVTGKIILSQRANGSEGQRQVQIVLKPLDSANAASYLLRPEPDGQLPVEKITPGHYWLEVVSGNRRVIDGLLLNGSEAANNMIDLTTASFAELGVELGTEDGSVSGTVASDGNDNQNSMGLTITVVLLRVLDNQRVPQSYYAEAQSDGSFHFSGLSAGYYELFALQNALGNKILERPECLVRATNMGDQISLARTGNVSRVLKAIPIDRLEQLFKSCR